MGKPLPADLSTDQVFVIASGLVCCSVCAPDGMRREVVEAWVNQQNPTGIEGRWAISEDPTFKGGQPNPCACDQEPGRRHWLLNC